MFNALNQANTRQAFYGKKLTETLQQANLLPQTQLPGNNQIYLNGLNIQSLYAYLQQYSPIIIIGLSVLIIIAGGILYSLFSSQKPKKNDIMELLAQFKSNGG